MTEHKTFGAPTTETPSPGIEVSPSQSRLPVSVFFYKATHRFVCAPGEVIVIVSDIPKQRPSKGTVVGLKPHEWYESVKVKLGIGDHSRQCLHEQVTPWLTERSGAIEEFWQGLIEADQFLVRMKLVKSS
jgi:hypothetical protein